MPRKRPAAKPWPSLGWQIVDWIETLLRHGPGDVQGQPIELPEPWVELIVEAYRVHPETGRRRYNEAAAVFPKGTAKSSLVAAPLCIAEGVGPVRFDHFAEAGETSWWGYEYELGEPVGRRVTGAEILILATSEDQTGNTYEAVYDILRNSPIADHVDGLDVGLTRTNLPGGGSIEVVTSKARSKDGGRSSFVVCDESHLWTDPELWRLFSTIQRNIVKRAGGVEPWMLQTTTVWAPGEGSVAEATGQLAEEIRKGKVKDPRLLFVHRQAKVPERWDDDRAMRKALAEAYAGFSWMSSRQAISAQLALIRDPRTRREDACRYFLGVPESSGSRWFSDELIRARRSDAAELAPGDRIVAGFDGSKSEDSTALVAVRVDDGVAFELGLWEKPVGPDAAGWQVPAAEVDERVRWMLDTYQVLLMYADPPYWRDFLLTWQAEWPDVVLAFETNRPKDMDAAIELAEDGFRAGKATIHRSADGLARHLGNTVTTVVRDKRVIRKNRQALKIDASVAWCLAWRAYV